MNCNLSPFVLDHYELFLPFYSKDSFIFKSVFYLLNLYHFSVSLHIKQTISILNYSFHVCVVKAISNKIPPSFQMS